MKCPFKFGRQPFEGGEDCDEKCAWRVRDYCGANYCAVSVLAKSGDRNIALSNKVVDPQEYDG